MPTVISFCFVCQAPTDDGGLCELHDSRRGRVQRSRMHRRPTDRKRAKRVALHHTGRGYWSEGD